MLWLVATATVSGCGTIRWDMPPSAVDSPPDGVFTQAPNPTVSLPVGKAVALAGATAYAVNQYETAAVNINLAAAALVAAYVIYDPLAPNWTIQERLIDRDTYVLSMRAKSFRIGGDGESGLILRRRALQLQQERGYPGFRILNYSEGVESSTPFTHRYAEGTIQLVRADASKTP